MPWVDMAQYAAVGGLLVRRGRQSLNPNPFVIGTTKPNALNVGLPPLRPLTTVIGDVTITSSAGTLLEGLDIFGRVKVQAANVTIRNCRVRGANNVSGNTALIDCNHPNASNVLIENCDLRPDFPSIWLNAVIGHNYTIRYCHIWDVVDGLGVYNSYAPTAHADVTIEANFIHDLAYFSPDPNHNDNRTHNDGIQIQGNGWITIRGNTVWANVGSAGQSNQAGVPAPNPYYPSVTGQAIGITPNVSVVTNTLIELNWIDYGAQSITIASGNVGDTNTTALVRLNKFGRNQPNLNKGGTTARRAILMTSDLTNPQGLPSVTGLDTNNGNVYEDNGQPVTVYRLAAA